MDQVGRHVDVLVRRVHLDGCAGQAVCGLEKQLGREQQRILLVELVQAEEPSCVDPVGFVLPNFQVPGERADDAPHHRGVPAQIDELERVVQAGCEDVDREGTVGALPDVEEAGRERQGHVVRHGVVVVVGDAAPGVRMDHVGRDVEGEPVTELLLHRHTAGLLFVAGVAEEALVVADQERAEVVGRLAAAGQVRRCLAAPGGPAEQLPLVVERLAGPELRGRRLREGLLRLRQAVELAETERVGDLAEAHPLGDAGGDVAAAAALGGDDDDAVRRLGAVEGRRRRPLQHLDRLDVVGVEVGDAVGGVVLVGEVAAPHRAGHRRQTAGDGGVGKDDAVDDVQHVVGAVDGRHAAELHLDAAARGARVRLDVGAGELALERVLDGVGGHLADVIAPHRRRTVDEVGAHDHRRALDDGDGLRRPLRHGDRHALLIRADVHLPLAPAGIGDDQRHRTDRGVVDQEGPVGSNNDGALGALHVDDRSQDRLAGLRVFHRARDGAGLRCRRRRGWRRFFRCWLCRRWGFGWGLRLWVLRVDERRKEDQNRW